MSYEAMLDNAYEKVEVVEDFGRFEVLGVKGHFEGTRTVITNFGQVAACLRRKPEHLGKFLCKELASPCDIKGDRVILTRKIKSGVINDKIEKYIKEFVTCGNCGKPDTELIEEKGKKVLKCMACGNKKGVHEIQTHKREKMKGGIE